MLTVARVSPRSSHTGSPLDSSSGLLNVLQKVFNAISLLTFVVVSAQVAGVVYLVNNQESIREAIVGEAVAAVTSGMKLPGLGEGLPVKAPAPSALSAPTVGAPSIQMFMP